MQWSGVRCKRPGGFDSMASYTHETLAYRHRADDMVVDGSCLWLHVAAQNSYKLLCSAFFLVCSCVRSHVAPSSMLRRGKYSDVERTVFALHWDEIACVSRSKEHGTKTKTNHTSQSKCTCFKHRTRVVEPLELCLLIYIFFLLFLFSSRVVE